MKDMSTNTISRPKKSTSIRIDADVFDKIKSMAESEHRTFSNYVEYILIKMLDQEPIDRTDSICQGLREVKMIKDGKLKAKTADELFDEL